MANQKKQSKKTLKDIAARLGDISNRQKKGSEKLAEKEVKILENVEQKRTEAVKEAAARPAPTPSSTRGAVLERYKLSGKKEEGKNLKETSVIFCEETSKP